MEAQKTSLDDKLTRVKETVGEKVRDHADMPLENSALVKESYTSGFNTTPYLEERELKDVLEAL
jgi:hypothetical protein